MKRTSFYDGWRVVTSVFTKLGSPDTAPVDFMKDHDLVDWGQCAKKTNKFPLKEISFKLVPQAQPPEEKDAEVNFPSSPRLVMAIWDDHWMELDFKRFFERLQIMGFYSALKM